jgi:hypothetical protein
MLMATAFAIAVAGCNNDTPTSPTTTTPTTTTTTTVEPTSSEEFTGTVSVGGFSFYSFTVEQNGIVRITWTSAGGTNVPASVWLGLGLGTPAGEDCVTTTSLNTQASTTAQISGTYAPGIYCVKVYDIGNLVAPARFSVTIEHP